MASSATASAKPNAPNGSITGALGQKRPSLLHFNRRLRNLRSLSLRNINLDIATPGRPRGKTIDDDADPRAFVSPTKLRALREDRTVEHSHSSSDLRRDNAIEIQSDVEGKRPPSSHSPSKTKIHLNGVSNRKRPNRPRRRSTMDWLNASSSSRQERLESVQADRMSNVFYSLHVEDIKDPVYISETVEHTMDPTFHSMEFTGCGAGVLRQTAVLIRFWTQSLSSLRWRLLKDWHIRLEDLYFISTDIEHARLSFEHNTPLFHFEDGVYTLPALVPFTIRHSHTEPDRAKSLTKTGSHEQRRTSSFDALLKLAKLTDSIEDALVTRDKLTQQLDSLLIANQTGLEQRDRVTEVEDRCKTIVYARDTVVKQVAKAKKQIAEKRAILANRRKLLKNDQTKRDTLLKEMRNGYSELPHLRDERQLRKVAITAQQRRVAEDLAKVYPINSVSGDKALAFTIRGLALPNAEELDGVSAAEAAAALGFVAQATQLLSFYLGIALPYHVRPMGSTSWIIDPISLVTGSSSTASAIASALRSKEDKLYPLNQSRVARFRFEYGVFLLNKDIQLLLESGFGVRVVDIRHTLANLKYLFYVATAGVGDLPARKAGGIRGLLKHSPRASLSRESSSSSVPSWSGLGGQPDKREAKGAVRSLKELVQG